MEWPLYGLDQAETHYSPLDQIHADNMTRLGLEWAFDAESFAGQMEGTPLMVNGTLYFISARPFANVTWATGVDPRTGRPIETPEADYGFEGILISPGSDGAHNWHAMSWNPVTGLVYSHIDLKNSDQSPFQRFSVDPDPRS
ncbi:MAG: hypothetical protein ACRD1R_14890 [Acidobacteriota bacterium]